jgi:hypothetical protein
MQIFLYFFLCTWYAQKNQEKLRGLLAQKKKDSYKLDKNLICLS